MFALCLWQILYGKFTGRNEILLRGLSMPHSPRWYENKLWVPESSRKSLAEVDLGRRTWGTVAEMPGFTRGIDFYGPLAFIGFRKCGKRRSSATSRC